MSQHSLAQSPYSHQQHTRRVRLSWVWPRTRSSPQAKNLQKIKKTQEKRKKAVALQCFCLGSRCPGARPQPGSHTVCTQGQAVLSVLQRASRGTCSKPFIRQPWTRWCGSGQCWSPACCREERLEEAAPLGITSGLDYKLSLHDRQLVGTSFKSALPSSTTVLHAGVRWFSYYLISCLLSWTDGESMAKDL